MQPHQHHESPAKPDEPVTIDQEDATWRAERYAEQDKDETEADHEHHRMGQDHPTAGQHAVSAHTGDVR